MPHHNATLTIDFGSWQHNTPRADPPWRSWCKSPIWRSIRRHRLAEEPLCRQCAIEGRTVVASHVDHVDPHRGQWLQFFKYENTQSLCAHHHNRHKRHGKRASDYEKLVVTHFRTVVPDLKQYSDERLRKLAISEVGTERGRSRRNPRKTPGREAVEVAARDVPPACEGQKQPPNWVSTMSAK